MKTSLLPLTLERPLGDQAGMMAFSRGPVFLLFLLYLLWGSDTSLIKLNGNGYEDIIIAIDPAVPEDTTIIEHIKGMVTKASTYLFEATEKKIFLQKCIYINS